MHWVLSNNLKSDAAFPMLLEQLDRQGTPFTLIGMVPFSGEVIDVAGDVKLESLTGPVFGCGKGSMKHAARRYGWSPGYIEAADYTDCLKHYGMHMLNHDAIVGKLCEVVPTEQRFFVRPNADVKSFSGQLMNKDEFLDWQRQMSAMEDSATITKDDIIILATLKDIYAEYRLYIVDGKVISGSLYKRRDTVVYVECIDRKVIDFAQQMAELYSPNMAYVLDIADTPDGLRVLETNSISSSGFYAIDMGKFVAAINQLGESGRLTLAKR